jgi:hypothetical protein
VCVCVYVCYFLFQVFGLEKMRELCLQIVELAADLRRLTLKDNNINNLSAEIGSLPRITELYVQVMHGLNSICSDSETCLIMIISQDESNLSSFFPTCWRPG